MERVRAGVVEVANPYNSSQIKRIPLVPMREGMKPEDGVDAFVFWTRDPKHILANAQELSVNGYPFYVMVSVTGYPNALEPNQASVPEVLESMKELSCKIGKEKVIWRYDPVILTDITGNEFHCRNFKKLSQDLSGYVKRVIISIYDEYPKAARRLGDLVNEGKLKSLDMNFDDLYGNLLDFKESSLEAGMEIQSCAEKENYSSIGINSGACIDAALLEKQFGIKISGRDKNQRANCLCCKSTDIGSYNTCAARCVYCYAI
jgi:hypothetical protein